MALIDEEDTRVFTDHNVYVLGAGFSADAGIPVLNDFLFEMRKSYMHDLCLQLTRDARRLCAIFERGFSTDVSDVRLSRPVPPLSEL